jgi:hypothetical protein
MDAMHAYIFTPLQMWNPTLITMWSAAKSLVRPKMGLSYSNSGIVRNSGHAPSSQH